MTAGGKWLAAAPSAIDAGRPWLRLRLCSARKRPGRPLHSARLSVLRHPRNEFACPGSLQVFRQLGRKHSEVLREQRAAAGGSSLGGPLRYPNSIILWPQCQQEILDARLDARVDEMMQRGLVAELEDVHRRYNQQRLLEKREPDYTEGIFQSIGFKEFHSWLVQPEAARRSEQGQAEMRRCADALKAATRRYARKQLRWIRNRFLRRPDRQVPPVYAVDTTDPGRWEELVAAPAMAIVNSHLRGLPPPQDPLPVEPPLAHQEGTFHCPDCDRVFVGTFQWQIHLRSKKHARRAKKKPTPLPTTAQKEGTVEEGLSSQDTPEPVPKEDPPQETSPKKDPPEETMLKAGSPEEMVSKQDHPDESLRGQDPPEEIKLKEDAPEEGVPKENLQMENFTMEEPQEEMLRTEDAPVSGSGSGQQRRGDENEPVTSAGDRKSGANLETKHQVQCAEEGSPPSGTINGTTSPKRE
ncbi:tRNA dimethylallyltransferase-like [Schistocerca nitens]|uniref:tRNA dimethylallyltransferase-like n=1 Tax=Schistocerca nitens TaxID=7011 RepID=UPI002119209A|nr:tRNA dimethylallyltransferase-like [Schistocerca nitens]